MSAVGSALDVDDVRAGIDAAGGSITGVGLDVVDVASFAEQLDVPGSSFLASTFTAGERSDVVERRDGRHVVDPRRLAVRFAAKEAFLKAWSNGRFGQQPQLRDWSPSEIEVVGDAWGRSRIRLHGQVARAVDAALGDDWAVHVSLSHDGPVAAAIVVLAAAHGGPR